MKRALLLGLLVSIGCGTTVTPRDGQIEDAPQPNDTTTNDTGTLSNCDGRHVLCNGLPPVCPSHDGNIVPEVAPDNSCWTGRCMQPSDCAPIVCDPAVSATQCPGAWHCDPATSRCVPTPCPTC